MVVHYLDPHTWRPLCDVRRDGAGRQQLEGDLDSPWTFVKGSVTCPECLRALDERERSAGD